MFPSPYRQLLLLEAIILAIILGLQVHLCSPENAPQPPAANTGGMNDEQGILVAPDRTGWNGTPDLAGVGLAFAQSQASAGMAGGGPGDGDAAAGAGVPPPPLGGRPADTLAAGLGEPAARARLTRAEFERAAAAAGWVATDEVFYVACGVPERGYSGESGCDPGADNPDGPFRGLVQAHWPFWWEYCGEDPATWADPVANLRLGRCVYEYYLGRWGDGWLGWPNTRPPQ